MAEINWYYHSLARFGEKWHGYIKSDNHHKALIRLQRDDPLWSASTVQYNGIVSETVVKRNVNFKNSFDKEGFERGIVITYKREKLHA